MYGKCRHQLRTEIDDIRAAGLYKSERIIDSPQSAHVEVGREAPVLNLCSNNYLGLANHPDVISAAHEGLDEWGYGLASVRFICGTQTIHKQLEEMHFGQSNNQVLKCLVVYIVLHLAQ